VGSPTTDGNNGMHGVEIATAIFAEYGRFIRGIIRSKIGQRPYEEDLFQDFFLSLAHKPPPDDIKDIKSYLYRAITHDIVDAVRRMNTYRKCLEKYGEQTENSVNTRKSTNAITYSEDIDRVLTLIENRLPDSQSRAIILRYKHGYEIKEIAEEMCIDSRSVSRYISVGLRTVRKFFAGKRGNSNG
jgi:RNA polymerase sigma factor (sigma-70 family)